MKIEHAVGLVLITALYTLYFSVPAPSHGVNEHHVIEFDDCEVDSMWEVTDVVDPKISDNDIKEPTKVTVLATKYHPVESQCDSDPLTTADLSKINLRKLNNHTLRWIAVSRDLLDKYPHGSKVKIHCSNSLLCGEWEVHDSMNSRYRNRIDFLVPVNDKYNFHKPMKVSMELVDN